MPALGHARKRRLALEGEEENRPRGPSPANRASTRRPKPPAAVAESAVAAMSPQRVRIWTFWIALVVSGFLWQFVSSALGFLRSR
ncbi:MAG TPA: hypothetical protein VMU50_04860 [Polyangia bacterium]|nr:hypothetical protein [Polyangia bacterium]